MPRRPAFGHLLAGLLAVGLLAAGLAGCDGPSSTQASPRAGRSPSPSALVPIPTDAPAALWAASAKLSGQSLRFTLGNGIDRADGVYDARSGGVSLVLVRDGRTVEVDTFGAEQYLVGFTATDTVLRVDVAKLPAGHGLLPAAAPLVALSLLTGLTQAGAKGPGEYRGTINLSRVGSGVVGTTRRLVDWFIKQAGDQADEIGFTASIDRYGRLVRFKATFPKADSGRDLTYEFRVLEVGTTATVARPNGPNIVDAPPDVYQS